MVLFCGDVFSCVITLLVRTDLAKIGLWRVHHKASGSPWVSEPIKNFDCFVK